MVVTVVLMVSSRRRS